jgi:hypothetical protein
VAGNHPDAGAPPLLNQRGAFGAAHRMGAYPPEDSGVSHYVYEKTRAYRKFEGNGLNCMSLMKKELSKSCGRGVEKKGIKI